VACAACSRPTWTPEGERRETADRPEGLYVIRHPSFEKIIKDIKDIVEDEPDDNHRPAPLGVLVKMVEPEEEREKRDLPIARIVGAFEQSDDWVEKIGRSNLPPLPVRFPYVSDLKEVEGIIKHETAAEDARTEGEAPLRYDVQTADYASIDAVITSYARILRNELRLSDYYLPAIKGIVKAFLERATFDLKASRSTYSVCL
jgi:hypothetical protein